MKTSSKTLSQVHNVLGKADTCNQPVSSILTNSLEPKSVQSIDFLKLFRVKTTNRQIAIRSNLRDIHFYFCFNKTPPSLTDPQKSMMEAILVS